VQEALVTDIDAIRRQVSLALAANRAPGFHYPGFLLGLKWPRIGESDLEEVMPDRPQARNVDGSCNLAAFCVLLDTALATASRLKTGGGVRQATVHLHAQFTGAPLRGEVKALARFEGYAPGATTRQSLTSGILYAGGEPVCRASATFIVLPPPPGVNLGPLPWQRAGEAPVAPIARDELQPDERAVMRQCESALKRASPERAFIEHFWGALPVVTADGARCSVKIGAQHGNRVGHVQGGLSFGLGAIAACAAAPNHPQLSAIAAWYISPGQGKGLRIRSRRIHEGRSFAAVRTEIRNADGSRVLEVASHHAA
jgi:acyl-coenzyme A thioesterase PaaI-like protein